MSDREHVLFFNPCVQEEATTSLGGSDVTGKGKKGKKDGQVKTLRNVGENPFLANGKRAAPAAGAEKKARQRMEEAAASAAAAAADAAGGPQFVTSVVRPQARGE